MHPPVKEWKVAPRAPETHFARFPDLQPLVVQVLYNRGLREIQEVADFLDYACPDDDPFALKGMGQAVERIAAAIARQEPIAIYGDYDADGVTATALLVQLLAALGAQVQYYIPNRFDEGYGLNKEALTELAERGVRLVLTVDCGIRSVAEIAHGNSLGLDIIVTDHHHPGEVIPPALATINPKQQDCGYRFKKLAGVGLAYKLGQALLSVDSLKAYYQPDQLNLEDFIDLVAVGTVADLAPLCGENRSLVERGLRRLNGPLRPGLGALMQKIGTRNRITAGTIGFAIGPRLNAAGRLDSAVAAYQLLVVQNELEAIPLAAQLDLQNQERQRLTLRTVELARQDMLSRGPGEPIYFIGHPDFNPGIVGLAASRLVEEFYRPVLVAHVGASETKGSARSIPGFHITDALDLCADLLVRHGGHSAAAGFTIENEKLPVFQERLHRIAGERLDPARLSPTIEVDAVVNLRGVRYRLVEEIAALQPFGYGNPTPCFQTNNLKVKFCRTVGHDDQHLRLVLNDGRQDWSAIAFKQGHWAETLQTCQTIDAVYHLEFNDWNGERTLQLEIKDLRPSSS